MMLEWQNEIRNGMLLMVSKNRDYIEATHKILRFVHGKYILENAHYYSEQELFWINHYLDSIVYKSFLVRISIEQLQSIRHGKIYESLWPAMENGLFTLNCSDDEQILISLAFESFLYEARSLLDIYMIFVSLLLRTGFTNGHMSKQRFYDELGKELGSPFDEKALWMKQFFEKKVFSNNEKKDASIFRNDWGSLLKSLRDRIAHRDVINLTYQSKEKLVKEILLDWPTINKITYHLLAETIGNGIHSLFTEGLCHIYELKWDDYQYIARSR